MGEPIRIAHVLNRMDSGGIETIVTEYYRHINREQIQFDFYYADDSSIRQKDELQRMGAGTYAIPDYSKPLRFHQALYKAFRTHCYLVVHVHLNSMSVFALFAAWRAGVPVRICHNHSTAHWSEGKVTWLKYFLRPLNLVFANRYYACGNVAAEWMYGKKRISEGKVIVIPNAIDTEKYKYDSHARSQLREELGINSDAFVVGHVGRFKHQKNHRFLLEAFHALLCEKPNAVLLLIGEGRKVEEIRMLAEKMGIAERVIFTGVRQDMDRLYSTMDVFCLPSYYEGMPLVAWEAQCNGLPCIFADTITQEARLNENVEFVSITDTSAWVKAICMAQRSVRPVEARIDIHTCVKKLEELYLAECR